ncbi:MAG TPA: aminopeptidase P N-terminal domain-containing protein [Capsulimonadaceae bacterium]|nr:aminopeptidase P N-terminal domain-containing protein [Capsulimonadaceae bacterium]
MATPCFPPEEFVKRRARVFDEIEPGSHALIQGAGPVSGFELFRQTNEFFYLTGLDVPRAYLLMDAIQRESIIYLPNDDHDAGEGAALGLEDAPKICALTGVDQVCPLEVLETHLGAASRVYVAHSPAEGRYASQDTLRCAAKIVAADPWDTSTSREERFIRLVGQRRPKAEICNLSPILDELRRIKSPLEVDVMRFAGKLSALSVVEAMRCTRAGLYEYQLGAVADYIYRVNGARSEAYRPIIASGANIWEIHYHANSCVLRDGDLVLMDYAPDLCNYTSDIGRMWPVNGKYSALQRELYGFMVEYHKVVLAHIRPGVMPQQILDEAAAKMEPVVKKTQWSKPVYQQAAERTLKFKGHLSHPVGMAVHDVGKYFDRLMEPGLVISVDPQMWVPEEKLYIRVEDTITVTKGGIEILTSDAPLELDDVEATMKEPGLLQQFPPLSR